MLRYPAEWERQRAVWLSWPASSLIWPDKAEAVQELFGKLAALMSHRQTVSICADESVHPRARSCMRQAGARMDRVELIPIATDDVWIRDHGPVFLESDQGVVVSDWCFNAWGGKFRHYVRDNAVPGRIAAVRELPVLKGPEGYILEGGALETNGSGVLLTTASVLANPNRNPGISIDEHCGILRSFLGVSEIVILEGGLENDDTDGHVDNVARFFQEDAVLVVDPSENPVLLKNLQRLKSRFEHIVLLPNPCVRDAAKARRPASYANFVLINDAVIYPTFGVSETDQEAGRILGECFSSREVIPFDGRVFLEEGGGIHCLTCNEPEFPDRTANKREFT